MDEYWEPTIVECNEIARIMVRDGVTMGQAVEKFYGLDPHPPYEHMHLSAVGQIRRRAAQIEHKELEDLGR